MKLIDSHCHLNMLDLNLFDGKFENILKRASEAGVTHFLCPGVDVAHLPDVIALAEKYDNVFAAVGMHPDESPKAPVDFVSLSKMAAHPKVIGIGETGLDYYRIEAPYDWQHARFVGHIEMAKQLKKPLIIHTRQAAEDTLRILKQEKADEAGGVFHCFTENWETAKAGLDLGFYISISGIVTFKSAESLRDVVRKLPHDRILIETDCPYLAPMPFRGKPNEPAYVRYVAAAIADLLGLSLIEVAEMTSQNFKNLFKL